MKPTKPIPNILLEDLRAQIAARRVVLFVGAGLSLEATDNNPKCSWLGLLQDGVERCCNVVHNLPSGWAERVKGEIDSGDIDELLSAAEKVSRKLGAPSDGVYRGWLRDVFSELKPSNPNTLRALADLQVPIVTTNYDSLLEAATGLQPFTWRQKSEVERVLRGEQKGVVHLHGHWETPESVILGIRSYSEIIGDKHTQAILQAIRTIGTVVYLGFGSGLQDPHFSSFLRWSEEVFAESENRHFRLVLASQVDEVQKEHPPASRIHVLPFGKTYNELGTFLNPKNSVQNAPEARRSTKEATYGVSIIGCGDCGQNLAKTFRPLQGFNIVSLCDSSKERLQVVQELFPAVTTTTDSESILADENVQAVAIATPLSTHFELARKCLEADKHVLVEPPLASSVAQCQELISLAKRMQRVLMVAHTDLYSDGLTKVKEIIKCGDIGEPRYINCQRLNLGTFRTDCNVIWDFAHRDLSIILHLLEEVPVSVNCQAKANRHPRIEDLANMTLSFEDNKCCTILNSWLAPRHVCQMTIVGSKRMITYDDTLTQKKIRIYDARIERTPHYDPSPLEFFNHSGDEYVPYHRDRDPLINQCQHFLDCILNGSQPLTGGTFGAEIVHELEAASMSVRMNGGLITLPKRLDLYEAERSRTITLFLPSNNGPRRKRKKD